MTTTAEWLNLYGKMQMADGCCKDPTSVENLKRLTDVHVARYRKMLQDAATKPGTGHYKVPELRELLSVWESVADKKYVFADLASRAQDEIYDAVFSGE